MSVPTVSMTPRVHGVWVALVLQTVCSCGETPNTNPGRQRANFSLPSICAFSGWGLLMLQGMTEPSDLRILPLKGRGPSSPWAGAVMGSGNGWVTHRTLFSSNCVRGLWGDIIPLLRCALPNMTRTKWQPEKPGTQSFKTTGQHKKIHLSRHKAKLLLSSLEVSWRHRTDPLGLENSLSGHCTSGIPGRQLWCFCLSLLSPLYLQLATSCLLWFPTEF